jgi:uncharacterized protein
MKIGIDMDEVIANQMQKLCEFYNLKKGKLYSEKDFHTYNWWEVWGISREEAENIDKEFKNSELFNKIEPVEGAIDTITLLSKTNKLFIITSRPEKITEKTKEWVLRYLGGNIDIIHSGDFWGKKKSKLEICRELGVELMIEDHIKYSKECAENGVKVILIDKPWNKDLNHDNITRVKSWKEILEVINGSRS